MRTAAVAWRAGSGQSRPDEAAALVADLRAAETDLSTADTAERNRLNEQPGIRMTSAGRSHVASTAPVTGRAVDPQEAS